MENLELVLPEILISIIIMFLLIFGVYKKNSYSLVYNLGTLGLLVIPILFFGFYPEPLMNSIETSVANILDVNNFNQIKTLALGK